MTLTQFKKLFSQQINTVEKGSKLYYGVRDGKANKMEILATKENNLDVIYASLKNSTPDSPAKLLPWFTK
jgi:hypothetical protein